MDYRSYLAHKRAEFGDIFDTNTVTREFDTFR